MRSQLALCAAALALAGVSKVLAQEADFEVSAFVEPAGSYSDYHGFELDTGVGAGIGWRFSSHWTAEGRFLLWDGDFADVETYQLGLRYAFFDPGARWRPFVTGGLHFGQTELRREVVCVTGPCPEIRQNVDDTGLFAGGGVDWQLSDWFALRFEGRLQVYDSELSDDIEEDLDATVGVVFRF